MAVVAQKRRLSKTEHYKSWRGTVTETKHIKYKSYHKIQRMDNFVNDILRKEAA